MPSLVDILATLGASGVLFIGTLGAFVAAERWTSDPAKQKLASELRSADFSAWRLVLPEDFNSMFDRVFGLSYFTVKAFARVTVFYFVTFSFILLACYLLNKKEIVESFRLMGDPDHGFLGGMGFLRSSIFWLCWGLALTYVNLYKTQILIKLIAGKNLSFALSFAILVLDFLISIAILVAVVCLMYTFTGRIEFPTIESIGWAHLWGSEHYLRLAYHVSRDAIAGTNLVSVWLFTSITASGFLYLYIMANGLFRLLGLHQHLTRGFLAFYDLDKHPLALIGFVAASVAFVVCFTWQLLKNLIELGERYF
jgi:hypothetical protein